eukprot:gene6346-6143_t
MAVTNEVLEVVLENINAVVCEDDKYDYAPLAALFKKLAPLKK